MPGIKSRASAQGWAGLHPGQHRLRGELLVYTWDWMTAVKWGLECDSRPNTHRHCPHCGKRNAKVPLSTKALGGILKLLSIVAGWAWWRNTKWCLKYVNRTNAIVSGSEKAFVWFSTNSEVTVIYLDVVECTRNSSTQKTEVEAAGIWVQGQPGHSEAIYLFIHSFFLSFSRHQLYLKLPSSSLSGLWWCHQEKKNSQGPGAGLSRQLGQILWQMPLSEMFFLDTEPL